MKKKNSNKSLYVIFGPPGSGKTIQADLLTKQLNLDHISWGFIFRDEKFKEEYKEQLEIIDKKNITDRVRWGKINFIIENEIKKLKNSNKSLIIDGYPRGLNESKYLVNLSKKYNYKLDTLIKVNPSFEAAYNRCRDRLVCKLCRRYYDDLRLPKNKGFCDYDKAPLVKAQFSKTELKKEFLEYNTEMILVLNFLKPLFNKYIDVSGDHENDLVTFSNILVKVSQEHSNNFLIFERKSDTELKTEFGVFHLISYQSKIDYSYHLALVKGNVRDQETVLLRVHSSCITGDIFCSKHCDCREQLHKSLSIISKSKKGILIYLFQEGRGINIINKMKAYALQKEGYDTVEANLLLGLPAEMRQYSVVKDILEGLKVKSVVLITNNPDKVTKLTDIGVVVEDIHEIEIKPGEDNLKYLKTKKERMRHRLPKLK